MGRPDFRPADQRTPLKFYLQRVPLDSGGYDSGGAYWGFGEPLLWAASVEEVLTTMWAGRPEVSRAEKFVRANDRDEAKTLILAEYPNATFFR